MNFKNFYKIKKPTLSYHQHTGLNKTEYILELLKSGKNLALVSDAGTPGISDPGGKLVALATKENIQVLPVPGASALTSIISISGVPLDRFIFLGFLPHNFYPQKIMPGYGGITIAGFFLALLGILSYAKLGTALLVLGIPMVDAVYTLIRRFIRRSSPVKADRGHPTNQVR